MPRDQIQEVKDKLDIVSVISSYFPLTKSGKNYKALCPFHAEKTPSFMVSPELQIFKCFGCGEGGDVIAFYAKMEGVGFGEALREMAKRAGVRLVRERLTPEEERRERILAINQLAADYFHYLLVKHRIGEEARKYLRKRGLSEEAIETFNLGYAPSSWDSLGKYILSKGYTLTDYLASGLGVKRDTSVSEGRGFYDFLRGRVIFPLRSPTGRVIAFSARTLGSEEPKYINTPETPVFSKRSHLFNLDLAKQAIKKAREVILVEGEMDAITLYERGIQNVVASKGTALTSEQVATLSRFADLVKLCFDKDTAGLEATKRGILLAQGIGLEVRAALLPSGKDPDEAIRSDEAGFRRALDKALPVFDFYLDSALERFDATTASGKKKIAAELLPVLKSFANEIEKATYLRKLAEVLGVPEEVLWRQLAKEKPLEVGEVPVRRVRKQFYPAREGRLLALVLSLPPQQMMRWLRKLSPEDFSDVALRGIFVQLKTYLFRVKRFLLANFSGKLDREHRDILESLILAPVVDAAPLDKELEILLLQLKKIRYQRERRELVKAVAAAEAEGKVREVRRLQKEVLKLSGKIGKL